MTQSTRSHSILPRAVPRRHGRLRIPGWLELLLPQPQVVHRIAMLAFVVVIALIAPLISVDHPERLQHPGNAAGAVLEPPLRHEPIRGATSSRRFVVGARRSLLLAPRRLRSRPPFAAILGITAAYSGGIVDEVVNFLINVFLVIPAIPLLIVVSGYSQDRGHGTMILVLALVLWAFEARILRGQALSLKNRDFVLAAKASGESTRRVVFGELMPNMISRIAAAFVLVFYIALLTTRARVPRLGDQSKTSWGVTLYWAQTNSTVLQGEWWPFFFPAPRSRSPCSASCSSWPASTRSATRVCAPSGRRAAARSARFGGRLSPRGAVGVTSLVESRRCAHDARRSCSSCAARRRVRRRRNGRAGRGRRRPRDPRGRDPSASRGVRLRQDDDRERRDADPASARRGSPAAASCSRARTCSARAPRSCAASAGATCRWSSERDERAQPVMRVGDQFVDAMRAHERIDRDARSCARASCSSSSASTAGAPTRTPHELSGGMRQRVIIAMALALRPE
jgi:ABC-type dipeptide/oligopeptide/nickel transport system permease subunit